MQSTYIGRYAEQAAAIYLEQQGYTIVQTNWRRRECEIDIVARKAGVAFCIEVKYRAGTSQGGGLDYIGPRKLRQMNYAARRWQAATQWPGDIALAALEVSGANYEVTAFIDDIYL